MRRRLRTTLALALAALLAAAGRSPAQPADARYWPLREINFPVPVDRVAAMDPKPGQLRFYVSQDGGPFVMTSERNVDDLELIDAKAGSRGFRYASPADGKYDFALQFVYSSGKVDPAVRDLVPQYRIVIDTRPPLVRLDPAGPTGVQWEVTDENADPDGVILQSRWRGGDTWYAIKPRAFDLRDRYVWQGLDPADPLEVRIVAKDRAGLEMASRPLLLPGTGTAAANPVGSTGLSDYGDPFPRANRPQIDYVNKVNLSIASKLTKVTRSGVKAAHLWVNDGKSGWQKAAEEVLPRPIDPATPDKTIEMKYTAPTDGLYGFIIVPVNGAGLKQDDPQANDPAQILVQVDTELPYVVIKSVKVTPGGTVGPRVEIDWETREKNPMPEPIVLSYSPDPDAPDAAWRLITPTPIADSGRYVWEVEDKDLWHFYVRASYVDRASNRSTSVYDKEVIVDLETPAAIIQGVESVGRQAGGSSAPGPGGGRPGAVGTPAPPAMIPPPVIGLKSK